MLAKIAKVLKRILLSFFMLYGYNILVPSEALIPINALTVLILSIFEIPGLLFLIVIKLFIY